jgi:large subunit ribosomal protein L1
MQKNDILLALKAMREQTKERKFVQSIELIINFKELDTKKPANQIDLKVNLPNPTGKKGSGKSLLFAKNKTFIEAVKGKFDRVIEEPQIQSLKKKEAAQIAAEYDVLLAEGPVMITVGKYLGQQLAPKGKMPKPVQPNPDQAEELLKQMGSVTRITNKKGKFMPLVQNIIGNEKMPDDQLCENALTIIESVTKQLPRKQQNVKSVYIKETMGPPIKVGAVQEEAEKK